MKTLKVLLQEVVSGIKAWVNSNFAQESNTVHKTGNETVNGNKTWYGSQKYNQTTEIFNTFNIGEIPDSEHWGGFSFTNGTSSIGSVTSRINTNGASYILLQANNKFSNNALNPNGSMKYANFQMGVRQNGDKFLYTDANIRNSLVPYTEDLGYVSVGTSTNRWRDVWCSNLNGGYLALHTTLKQKGVAPAQGTDRNNTTIAFRDPNLNLLGKMEHNCYSSGESMLSFTTENFYTNGALDPNGENISCGFNLSITGSGGMSLYPNNKNVINLGTSIYKWKTLNGLNPGALSLPNVNAVTGSGNTQLQDISGDLVQDQYFNCYFTPRMDGWAYIALNCSGASIRSGYSSYTVSVKTARIFADAIYTQSFTKIENAWSNVQILFPVTANKEITLELTFTGFSVTKAYVIPALGNV